MKLRGRLGGSTWPGSGDPVSQDFDGALYKF